MNCLDSRNELQRLLDGLEPARPGPLRDHLAACIACRESHRAAQRLLEGLRGRSQPVPPAAFAEKVVRRVLFEKQRFREKTRRRLYLTAALAASILVLVFAGEFWPPPKTDDPLPAPRPGPVAQKEIGPEAPMPPLGETVAEVGQAMNDLTERLASTAKDHAQRIIAAANPMEVAAVAKLPGPIEPPLEPAVESLRQAGQGVADGLQPLTRSAQRAFAFLVREVPTFDLNANE